MSVVSEDVLKKARAGGPSAASIARCLAAVSRYSRSGCEPATGCPHTAVHITNLINKIDLYVTSTSNGAHQFESLWKQDPRIKKSHCF